MTHLRSPLIFLLLAGCASVHVPEGEPPPVDPPIVTPVEGVVVVTPPIEAPPTLEACLDDGGALTLVATVNNDDVTEHGDLNTLAVDADGRIAVAAADGTIKMWTIADGFLGQLTTGEILYGAEFGATPAADLFIHEDWVVAGDVRGLVSAWTLEGDMQIWGGTDPEIGIVAVAFDEARRRLAHADTQVGGHVMVRSIDTGSVVGPLPTELTTVRDVAFLADGSLITAGSGLEIRTASDPTRVDASWWAIELTEVAVAHETIAIAGPSTLAVVDRRLVPRWTHDTTAHGPVGVALTSGGRYAITAGADGSLRVHRATDGVEIGSADVVDPVVIRAEPTGRTIFVGSREGLVHAFECRAE